MNPQLTVSIVLFNNADEAVKKTIASCLNTSLSLHLILLDNSSTDDLKKLARNTSIEYIFNNGNLGFGKAHNIAIRNAVEQSNYHLVLNPDVKFEQGILEEIFQFMEAHKDIGQLMPKVFYENGELQKLCHLLPTPVNLIGRRFFENKHWSKKLNDKYELKGFHYDKCMDVPNLSGCFMFLRCEALKKTGSFDERFFMYMEDVDFTRRMHASYKTLFYPHVSITHGFEKESYNNSTVLRHHINSAIKYINKWGWLYDKERENFNRRLIHELNNVKQDYIS
jgi:GT2 family glycosyltransferase